MIRGLRLICLRLSGSHISSSSVNSQWQRQRQRKGQGQGAIRTEANSKRQRSGGKKHEVSRSRNERGGGSRSRSRSSSKKKNKNNNNKKKKKKKKHKTNNKKKQELHSRGLNGRQRFFDVQNENLRCIDQGVEQSEILAVHGQWELLCHHRGKASKSIHFNITWAWCQNNLGLGKVEAI